MAHFAHIDENNIVIGVEVIDNSVLNNLEYPESEPIGQKYQKALGKEGIWLQCSYNSNFRGEYPSMGWIYDKKNDKFVKPSE